MGCKPKKYAAGGIVDAAGLQDFQSQAESFAAEQRWRRGHQLTGMQQERLNEERADLMAQGQALGLGGGQTAGVRQQQGVEDAIGEPLAPQQRPSMPMPQFQPRARRRASPWSLPMPSAAPAAFAKGGGVPMTNYLEGGPVNGGPPGVDTVPAQLPEGGYVLPVATVKALGGVAAIYEMLGSGGPLGGGAQPVPAKVSNGELVLTPAEVEALGGKAKLDALVMETNGQAPVGAGWAPERRAGEAAPNGAIVVPGDGLGAVRKSAGQFASGGEVLYDQWRDRMGRGQEPSAEQMGVATPEERARILASAGLDAGKWEPGAPVRYQPSMRAADTDLGYLMRTLQRGYETAPNLTIRIASKLAKESPEEYEQRYPEHPRSEPPEDAPTLEKAAWQVGKFAKKAADPTGILAGSLTQGTVPVMLAGGGMEGTDYALDRHLRGKPFDPVGTGLAIAGGAAGARIGDRVEDFATASGGTGILGEVAGRVAGSSVATAGADGLQAVAQEGVDLLVAPENAKMGMAPKQAQVPGFSKGGQAHGFGSTIAEDRAYWNAGIDRPPEQEVAMTQGPARKPAPPPKPKAKPVMPGLGGIDVTKIPKEYGLGGEVIGYANGGAPLTPSAQAAVDEMNSRLPQVSTPAPQASPPAAALKPANMGGPAPTTMIEPPLTPRSAEYMRVPKAAPAPVKPAPAPAPRNVGPRVPSPEAQQYLAARDAARMAPSAPAAPAPAAAPVPPPAAGPVTPPAAKSGWSRPLDFTMSGAGKVAAAGKALGRQIPAVVAGGLGYGGAMQGINAATGADDAERQAFRDSVGATGPWSNAAADFVRAVDKTANTALLGLPHYLAGRGSDMPAHPGPQAQPAPAAAQPQPPTVAPQAGAQSGPADAQAAATQDPMMDPRKKFEDIPGAYKPGLDYAPGYTRNHTLDDQGNVVGTRYSGPKGTMQYEGPAKPQPLRSASPDEIQLPTGARLIASGGLRGLGDGSSPLGFSKPEMDAANANMRRGGGGGTFSVVGGAPYGVSDADYAKMTLPERSAAKVRATEALTQQIRDSRNAKRIGEGGQPVGGWAGYMAEQQGKAKAAGEADKANQELFGKVVDQRLKMAGEEHKARLSKANDRLSDTVTMLSKFVPAEGMDLAIEVLNAMPDAPQEKQVEAASRVATTFGTRAQLREMAIKQLGGGGVLGNEPTEQQIINQMRLLVQQAMAVAPPK